MKLTVDHLVKRFGNFTAVDELCMEIPAGSVFGFVGPNGAGKTTTMKIMAGLLAADGGSILLDGQDALKSRKLLREKMGYMPDFFGVYDNLRVSEYMDFYAGTYYIPYADRPALIDGLLELVDLSHKKDAYVDSLSRGMKQRLCLARSLIHDPDILILDEPASGLDPRARMEMKEILKQLGSLGKTVIISSHILPELAGNVYRNRYYRRREAEGPRLGKRDHAGAFQNPANLCPVAGPDGAAFSPAAAGSAGGSHYSKHR